MAAVNFSKRYFTINEVSQLCNVEPHVLCYWERHFAQLKPLRRRDNRRFYKQQDVLLIRSIRSLLFEQQVSIAQARNLLVPSRTGYTDTVKTKVHKNANVHVIRQVIVQLNELLEELR